VPDRACPASAFAWARARVMAAGQAWAIGVAGAALSLQRKRCLLKGSQMISTQV
jgi:hypothetical protein